MSAANLGGHRRTLTLMLVCGGLATHACASASRDEPSVRHADLDGDGRTDVYRAVSYTQQTLPTTERV
jgi:hypothetical protein